MCTQTSMILEWVRMGTSKLSMKGYWIVIFVTAGNSCSKSYWPVMWFAVCTTCLLMWLPEGSGKCGGNPSSAFVWLSLLKVISLFHNSLHSLFQLHSKTSNLTVWAAFWSSRSGPDISTVQQFLAKSQLSDTATFDPTICFQLSS